MCALVGLATTLNSTHLEVRWAVFRLIIATLILVYAAPSCAEIRVVTIRGVVDRGTSTSGIYGFSPYYGFATQSEVAEHIFSVCSFLDECELSATVDEHNTITSIIAIRLIDTKNEPTTDIITDAAHWTLSTQEAFRSDMMCFEPVHISNFNSTTNGPETIFECDFKIIGSECRPYIPREFGTGTVRMVKRGDTWHYYR
jgi:hypothetical protein